MKKLSTILALRDNLDVMDETNDHHKEGSLHTNKGQLNIMIQRSATKGSDLIISFVGS